MSILETTLIFVGIPVVVTAIIAGLCYLAKPVPGDTPSHYSLDKEWTHEPVLWSAVDEVTTRPGHHDGGHHAAIEAGSADLIGGSASGRW
ncbi:hypothetical protein ACFYVR_04790 [Rhodococcus sp. NPDC003318]|uniref:aa3-type cytochrome oxidase subunit CtaJ n=1 Tax=Rhodococcus sp. NPDC003318 TaxID=3364503 RepID=UPI0036BF7985